MQPNEESNYDHIKEVLSKEFQGDFNTMTNEEIRNSIINFFYQAFLIDLDDVQVACRTTDSGTYVSFTLQGEAYSENEELLEEE